MLTRLVLGLALCVTAGNLFAQSEAKTSAPQPATKAKPVTLASPVPLLINGQAIRVDEPGYASPCLADVTGDGITDLLLGQFAGGRIRVFAGKKEDRVAHGRFESGTWLLADGKIASVPGVW